MNLLLAWAFAIATALVGSMYLTLRRETNRNVVGALWFSGLPTFPGAFLMLQYLLASYAREPKKYLLVAPLDMAVTISALVAIFLGPLAFIESARRAPPLQVPGFVNLLRGLFILGWGLAVWTTIMAIVYV